MRFTCSNTASDKKTFIFKMINHICKCLCFLFYCLLPIMERIVNILKCIGLMKHMSMMTRKH